MEPFGDYRADVRSAIIAQVVANANRGKNQRPYTVQDFMPKFKTPGMEERMPWEQMLQKMEAYTIAAGGEDLRDDNDSDAGSRAEG